MKPQVTVKTVSLKTGDEHIPVKDESIKFNTISDFEPNKIMEQVPLLRALKDQQDLIKTWRY